MRSVCNNISTMCNQYLLLWLLVTVGAYQATASTLMNTDEPPLVRCPRDLLCSAVCMEGRVIDDNGCPTCQCRDPIDFLNQAATDTPPCSGAQCFMLCPHGFLTDQNGCEICRCKPDPCEVAGCGPTKMCKVVGSRPVCKPKSMCNYMSEIQQQMAPVLLGGAPVLLGGAPVLGDDMAASMRGMLDQTGAQLSSAMEGLVSRVPDCEDESGLFVPRQCRAAIQQCWCVDDRGQELADSRHPMTAIFDSVSPCSHNLTQSAHVAFEMIPQNDLPDLHNILDDVRRRVSQVVTKWMALGKQNLHDFDVQIIGNDGGHSLQVEFILQRNPTPLFLDKLTGTDGNNNNLDIVSALYQLNNGMKGPGLPLDIHDVLLQPNIDSFTVEHRYNQLRSHQEPMLPSNGGLRPQPSIEENTLYLRGRNFCHRHPRIAIASLALGTLLVIALICFLALAMKKKQVLKRKDYYKENLSFANQCYDIGMAKHGDVLAQDSEKDSTRILTSNTPSIA